MNGNNLYQIRNDYYITYNLEDYPNGIDYYNAFTWDGILKADPVVNKVITLAPSLSKQQIVSSVSSEMLGDYRVLTIIITSSDKNLVKEISDTYMNALPLFADEIDMIQSINAWTDSNIQRFDAYTRDFNAAFLGGLISFFLSIFILFLYAIFDDTFYTERDLLIRYPEIPFLGKEGTKEYHVNRSYLLSCDGNYIILSTNQFDYDEIKFEEMRNSTGVILKCKAGCDHIEELDKIIFTLNKQNINIVGVEF